jgi:hypothetical protein
MTEPAKPRWNSFSLRTMFLLVTLLCVYLGWQLNIIRERSNALREFEASNKFDVTTAEAYDAMFAGNSPVPLARVPTVRGLLGDQAVQQIWYRGWGDAPAAEEIARVKKLFPEAEVFESVPEPCHPGCFPAGTLVETPSGPRRIEEIQPGDLVISLDAIGAATEIAVKTVFVTENHLWRVETELGELITTETQPLCTSAEATCQAGKLKSGDTVLVQVDGKIEPVRVQSVSRTDRTEDVFNLILGDSQVFVAGGYLARSKPPAEHGLASE